MQIREVFDRKRFVFLDGGMGTQLQARGLQPGQKPELAALEMPEVLTAIHTDYANAGADILLANTFGANAKKLTGCGHTVEEVVSASIACARKAADTTGACVALDIGPLGELLVPAGTLAFEDAYNEFAQVIRAGAAAGADLVFLETMTDLYELKAAILAARENCDLPVFTSMSFESRGRTFTGCTVESYAVTAAGLGADAVGINCSLGPKEILPFAQRLCRSVPAGVPVFVKPNAGLPNPDGSYNLDPDEFAAEMKEYAAIGVSMVGGCCGTTPAFIARLHETFSPLTPADKIPIRRSCLCTPVRFVEVNGITVVGERINPTGKKRLQQALRDGDSAYPCTQAVAQAEAGAQVLDVNAGLPGIDEAATLEQLVKDLQAITDLPLQLDSSNPEALSRALRIYNGKPIVNSVNGEPETLEKILPLCKKYGAAVVGLALDKGGIPPTAEGRFAIAQRIVAAANAAGIPNEDIYIDCLTLTASAQQEGAVQTLEALSRCKRELGVRTVLGVSNISFGLPCRGYLNTTFLTMAMSAGLDLAIMNPNTPEMMAAVRAYRVLTSQDLQSTDYVAAYADVQIRCQTVGAVGNGYAAGQINTFVDLFDYCERCENLTASDDGADKATDDEFYELMRASQDAYSCAGAKGGYIYFAKQVSTKIADVVANSPSDGTVDLYVLMDDGTIATTEIKNAVLAACNDDTVRPLTDKVSVKDPQKVSYNITFTYYVPKDSSLSSTEIKAAVDKAVAEFVAWQCGKLGRDINPSVLIGKLMQTGIKRVALTSPVFTTLRDGSDDTTPQVASVGTITATNGGYEDE